VKRTFVSTALLCLLLASGAHAAPAEKTDSKSGGKASSAKKNEPKDPMNAGTFAGLAPRGIGPAITSGRIIDLAIHPDHPETWYVATAGGGVWKTTNAGVTFDPVFDGQSSYSIGCVVIDPNNPLVVWVGSGENNSQRSVSYGDGVYKSVDGGKTWKNVGLKNSEHIGKIVIDPSDSNTVYVAAQGPLWAPGGDRGLYKTTDGGRTWKPVLTISENTGVTDVVMDPRNSDVLYAASYQRRRHVWTLINGGPESAIYKSTDGGASWNKLTTGLPKEELGRVGLAVAPSNPDVVYAIVEAARGAGGVFRSDDAGSSWTRQGSYVPGSAQYYQELFPDPHDENTLYTVDVYLQVTHDGGKNWENAGERYKHVDNHVVWIDPRNPDHLINGNDGGLYESFDRARSWRFFPNLPVTQFYRVDVDNDKPFYNVYGGTQDNFSLGGPSQTRAVNGIMSQDWFVTTGGDGFETVVDPEDPNILYAQSQYGELNRYDRRSGEKVDVKPQAGVGEPAHRFNWDSPVIISPHSHTRLYFAAQKVFRSDDRGNTWRSVSPDLTRQIDRNKLPVMGRIWGADAVAKSASTSPYGNIVALAESPKKEGLLYVGTDDGLIQVSEDGGANWRKIDRFPGVPENTYVSRVEPSAVDADTVFAAFDNHKMGDFKPYLFKSTDRGRTWTSMVGDLPKSGAVYAVVQDHVDPNLLFAGTEFGAFFTVDGGKRWIRFQSLPTVAVRDLAIQRRENDLALATFGRGFYILDDYTPLRGFKPETLQKNAVVFPVKPALMYIQSEPYGIRGKGFQGESFFTAPNPPFGAVFTYYLKDDLKTRSKQRQEAEESIETEGGNVAFPSWEELRAEDREAEPVILITISDEQGNVIRRLTGPTSAGFHRVAWDLRFPTTLPPDNAPLSEENAFDDPDLGPLAAPGTYRVSIAQRVDGKLTQLAEPQTFQAVPLNLSSLPPADQAAALAFHQKTARLQRALAGAQEVVDETGHRIDAIQRALVETPRADDKLSDEADALERRLADISIALDGDPTMLSRNETLPPAISDRVDRVVESQWSTTAGPTQTDQEAYRLAAQAFAPVLADLRKLVDVDLRALEEKMEQAGAPWTPGRLPTWQPE
jgi:photosystem II stability/assembly factor-like uncharacterized protein